MTKEIFAGFFKKAIPIAGGAIGGGITYLTFGPCCEKLRESLRDTMLSNPKHKISDEEKMLVIDIKEYKETDVTNASFCDEDVAVISKTENM